MRATTMALRANAPPDTAVDVVAEFLRCLVKEVATRRSLGVSAHRLLYVLRFAGLVLARCREFVSGATERDRTKLLELGRNLGTLAKALDDSQGQLKRRGIVLSMPLKGRLILRHLENLADEAINIAENAALGASAQFADRVHRELATLGDENGFYSPI